MSAKPLIVFALEQESQDLFKHYPMLYTGVGKVNAAFALASALAPVTGREKPALVVNLGTAGSRRHKPGTIINCTRFVQRDMDVTPLGFAPYQTPFSQDAPIFEYGIATKSFAHGVCGTGDNFDVSERAGEFDAVDMEAYALAVVAQRFSVPFLCLKFISDGADGAAHLDWGQALETAGQGLQTALSQALLDHS